MRLISSFGSTNAETASLAGPRGCFSLLQKKEAVASKNFTCRFLFRERNLMDVIR